MSNDALKTAIAALKSCVLENGPHPTDEQKALLFENMPKGVRFTREQFGAVNGLDNAAADVRLHLFERTGLVLRKEHDGHSFFEQGNEQMQRAKDIGALEDVTSVANMLYGDHLMQVEDGNGSYLWPAILPPKWVELQALCE